MEKAIVSTLEDMPRIQITTENRDVKDEKEFGWSKDPYKNASVDDRRVSLSRKPKEFFLLTLALSIVGLKQTRSRVGRWKEGQGRV